jgi:hypothetical protein
MKRIGCMFLITVIRFDDNENGSNVNFNQREKSQINIFNKFKQALLKN